MISGLRSVVRGLVESNLWPIAVVLLIAIVAVPVIVRGGAPDGDAGTPLAPVASAAADPVAPGAAGSAPADRSPQRPVRAAGRGRNPFRTTGAAASLDAAVGGAMSRVPAPATRAPASSGAGASASGSAGAAGTRSGAKRPAASAQATTNAPVASSAAPAGGGGMATVAVRFGASGALKTLRAVERSTALPSAKRRLVVFGGLRADGLTARFRLAATAVATGDGICRPTPSTCRSVDLRAGDTQLLEFAHRPPQRLVLLSVGDTPGPRSRMTAPAAARSTFSVRVRFGAAGAVRLADLHALQPLAAGGTVAFQHLGVGANLRSGVFLLGPRARLLSHNACLDGVACRVISLRPRATATVSIGTAHGPRRYQLRMLRVGHRTSSNAGRAARVRIQAAVAGQDVLRSVLGDDRSADAVAMLRVSSRTGAVSRRVSARRP